MDLSVIHSFFASLGFLLTRSALRLCSRLPSVVAVGGGVAAAAVVVVVVAAVVSVPFVVAVAAAVVVAVVVVAADAAVDVAADTGHGNRFLEAFRSHAVSG